MVKTRTKLTRSRKKNKSIRKRFRQKGGSGFLRSESFAENLRKGLNKSSDPKSESNEVQPVLPSPVSSSLSSQANAKVTSFVDNFRDRRARSVGNLEMIEENIKNCVDISNAYKEKHNELIEVYINYLAVLKENKKMAQEAEQNQENSTRLTDMLKNLDFRKILSKVELEKLKKVQKTMKDSWIQTTGLKKQQSATNIIEEINRQFQGADVQEGDTYQMVIDKLKALTDTSVSSLGGGKRNKKTFRKLKKYKKVFKRKSKKMRR